MGVNWSFLIMQAFVAMVLSMVCLAVYSDMGAIIGGYFVAQFNVELPFGIFLSTVIDALTAKD